MEHNSAPPCLLLPSPLHHLGRCIVADCAWAAPLRRVYELRYFNIAENEGEDEE